jgi:hypothetical protein
MPIQSIQDHRQKTSLCPSSSNYEAGNREIPSEEKTSLLIGDELWALNMTKQITNVRRLANYRTGLAPMKPYFLDSNEAIDLPMMYWLL